ncbi:hypothetical protein [Rhizobium sp. SSA_523]|uniref:hypothetical protein n=1 Tax=Rhizobium sp. SSA_523 TaxID=2952477 RepID=UPI00209132CF|nr:hypothetical protein [Rhizobium sp. SSA_523]MCO5734695.1 hypothetical protein [Rhizobium sp. SSA_523]WKC20979.1 hypothetical protein QTJ18_00210 [Rhizobium sp. SSA_523]
MADDKNGPAIPYMTDDKSSRARGGPSVAIAMPKPYLADFFPYLADDIPYLTDIFPYLADDKNRYRAENQREKGHFFG